MRQLRANTARPGSWILGRKWLPFARQALRDADLQEIQFEFLKLTLYSCCAAAFFHLVFTFFECHSVSTHLQGDHTCDRGWLQVAAVKLGSGLLEQERWRYLDEPRKETRSTTLDASSASALELTV